MSLKNFNKIKKSIIFILNHPLVIGERSIAIFRYLKFHILSRINNKIRKISFIEGTTLLIKRDLSGAASNYFTHISDFEEMLFMLHLLKSNKLFYDVGSNIGTWSILASGVVGCNSIAIEPIKETYMQLLKNIEINKINKKVKTYNFALGGESDLVKMSNNYGALNRVVENEEAFEFVEIFKLDHIAKKQYPNLIKIDVEGYEMEVINGAEETLLSQNIEAVIIELNGHSIKYGYSDTKINNKLLSLGFMPISYNPFKREIIKLDSYNINSHNTIYIKDYSFIREQLESSQYYQIGKYKI